MKVKIKARAIFERDGKTYSDVLFVFIDLMEMDREDRTLKQMLNDKLENDSDDGCTCQLSEGSPFCDCDGNGFSYVKKILSIAPINII